jgi:hypothetical protein
MRNEIVLDFRIWGFDDVRPEDITTMIGVAPSKVITKGQKKNPLNPFGTAIFKSNVWIMGSSLGNYASFEDQMNDLLNVIESKIDLFKLLCGKYHCLFSCALFIWYGNDESTPWVHLNSRYNRLIKEMNIEFDLDLYCLPNEEK